MGDKFNFAIEILIQAVCFYVGVIIFIGICLIPPLTLALPYIIPITFVVCMVMNIGFIIRFTKGTKAEFQEIIDEHTDGINLDLGADMLADELLDSYEDSLKGVENQLSDAKNVLTDTIEGAIEDITRPYANYEGYYILDDIIIQIFYF